MIKIYYPSIKSHENKTELYLFAQNYNDDNWKPNFNHLYLGFHK